MSGAIPAWIAGFEVVDEHPGDCNQSRSRGDDEHGVPGPGHIPAEHDPFAVHQILACESRIDVVTPFTLARSSGIACEVLLSIQDLARAVPTRGIGERDSQREEVHRYDQGQPNDR